MMSYEQSKRLGEYYRRRYSGEDPEFADRCARELLVSVAIAVAAVVIGVPLAIYLLR